MRYSRIAAFCLLGALAACKSAAPPPAATPAAPAARATPALPESIRWVTTSAEYVAATLQAYRAATTRVEGEAARRQAGTWAVVLDADETIISNALYQSERAQQGLGYSAESWNAWVKRRAATPIAGAAPFLARVRQLGGRIAIVTNRLGSECDDTMAVFRAHALVFDAMLCRPDGTPSDKNPRFEAVARGASAAGSTPLEIVAFVGDNILDFPQLSQQARSLPGDALREFGGRFFLMPNPMYGSWQ
jgi:5'-nucleotidase (lipoprotein e(P4) family)